MQTWLTQLQCRSRLQSNRLAKRRRMMWRALRPSMFLRLIRLRAVSKLSSFRQRRRWAARLEASGWGLIALAQGLAALGLAVGTGAPSVVA